MSRRSSSASVSGRLIFAGTPATSVRGGTTKPSETTAPAATSAHSPTTAPSRTREPMPMSAPFLTVQPWTMAACPIVTSSATTQGCAPPVTWRTQLSWMFVREPILMKWTSPRSTTPYQTETSLPISTSPMMETSSATKTPRPRRGCFPLNSRSNMWARTLSRRRRSAPQLPRPRPPPHRPDDADRGHADRRRGGAEAVGGDAGQQRGDGRRQRGEAPVGGEDAAADPVGRLALQAERRRLPLCDAAEVGEEDRHRADEETPRKAEDHVADTEEEDGGADGHVLPLVAAAGQAAHDEWPEERADAARGKEHPDAERAGAEDFPAVDAEQGNDAGAEAVAALHDEKCQDARIRAGVARGLADRFEQRRGVVVLARLVEARAHHPEDARGDEKRDRVDDEGDVAPEAHRHHAADGRADGEHRPPRRSHQHIGGPELLLGHDVRQRRLRGRLEVGRADGDADHAEIRERQQRRRARQEREEAGAGAGDVDEDHELAPVDAVDDVPGDRGDDEDRQRLAEEHQRRERRGAGELQD